MKSPFDWFKALLLPAMMLFCLIVAAEQAQAQFFDETLEQDELFVEDENQYFDSRFDDLGGDSREDDFTEGEKFIDESLISPDQRSISTEGRRFQLALSEERNELPLNIAWGAGTGLLIGGWLALISEGDNRETQRSIGLGIVTGILLGALVGTRTVFLPDSPRATGSVIPPQENSIQPVVSLTPGHPRIGVRLVF